MASNPPHDSGGFQIAVICALPLEAECVCDVLDKTWNDKQYAKGCGDGNSYTLGAIGEHNVVVVHMPGMGPTRAAYAAANLKTSFPNIKLALVVGVCGGMPYGVQKEEVLLGDVIISKGLVRYDFGKQYPYGFTRKTDVLDILGPPTDQILAFLAKLETRQYRQNLLSRTTEFLQAIEDRSPRAKHPGIENDILYCSSYVHKHHLPAQCNVCEDGYEVCDVATTMNCEDLGCQPAKRVIRKRLVDATTTQPMIHFGIIGSGDTVLKSGSHRDALAQKERLIAVEMEGAGVWRHGPSIVIKGVCNYADSHKRKGWQRYAAATAAACMKALLMEYALDRVHTNPAVMVARTSINKYFLVPRQRVKCFFGRESELNRIKTHFGDETSQRRILVLHAMGGQGKSQIALEYCQRSRSTYHGVFWINATSLSTIVQSLASTSRALNESIAAALSDDQARADFAVRTLEGWDHRWLVVFDSCDDATIFPRLEQFIPQDGQGSVLFTSRHRDLEDLGDLIEVPAMTKEDGVALLLHRYRGVDTKDYWSEGSVIVDRLGNLALAIDQASAYMHYNQLPLARLSSFLPIYLSQREKILQHTTQNFWRYVKVDDFDRQTAISAFTTWELSFNHFLDRYKNPDDVAHFLTISAFLGQTPVSESLFKSYWALTEGSPAWTNSFTVPLSSSTDTKGEVLLPRDQDIHSSDGTTFELPQSADQVISSNSKEPWNADSFWEVIQQAFQMSLLQSIAPASASYGAKFLLHPLIRDWLQLRLVSSLRQIFSREAADVVVSSIEACYSQGGDFQVRSELLLHMDAIIVNDAELFDAEHRFGREISTCCQANWFANFYRLQGRFDSGVSLLKVEIETEKRVLGEDHLQTLENMTLLAKIIHDQGQYSEAEQLSRTLLEVKKRTLGEQHPSTLRSMSLLAASLCYQGKWSESEATARTAIEIMERVLGKEDFQTLFCMENLAMVLNRQGKRREAEQIMRTIVEVDERSLGKDRPDTLNAIHNLAAVMRESGQFLQAEQIFRVLVEDSERILGNEHHDTLISVLNLALTLHNQGQYTAAEPLCRRAVEGLQRVLGNDHPNTLAGNGWLVKIQHALSEHSNIASVHSPEPI